jgi:hypothetical protein
MVSYALRPAFTPLTLLLMILGFIFFWPLGLAMLAYILFGHRIPEIRQHFESMKQDWNRERSTTWDWGCGPRNYRNGRLPRSGNFAFDDYREKELKRLEEERKRLDEELRDFESYVNDLRRARDAEEFDRFMRERAGRPRNGGGASTGSVPGTGNGNGNGGHGSGAERPSA